jgi:hypothetical protein
MAFLSDRVRWGVIDDARRRQRRQRLIVMSTAVLIVAAVVITLGGSSRRPGTSHSVATAPRLPPPSARAAVADACVAPGPRLTGRPSNALLEMFSALRRPATAADTPPQQLERVLRLVVSRAESGFKTGVFVDYVRRTAVIRGTSYYLVPIRTGLCVGPDYTLPYDAVIVLGFGSVIEGTATDIDQANDASTTSGFRHTTITMLVPDQVARLTLHYPAGRIGGYNGHHAPAITITAKPTGNIVVVTVPRSSNRASAPLTMTWRDDRGATIATFARL